MEMLMRKKWTCEKVNVCHKVIKEKDFTEILARVLELMQTSYCQPADRNSVTQDKTKTVKALVKPLNDWSAA
jgi:hypothetical protein